MVTGDSALTAIIIAKQAGILKPDWVKKDEYDCTVMTGREFRQFVGGLKMNDNDQEVVRNQENFKRVRDQLKVLAQASPADKYILATGLKQLGHVVAVTGARLGDDPVLRKADVGFAMGIAGT